MSRGRSMTFAQVQAIKARFRAAWDALRNNPLPAKTREDLAMGSAIMIVSAFPGHFRTWTEHLDDYEDLDPRLARNAFCLRHYFKTDMKMRAVVFVDRDRPDLYEVAEIGADGPTPRPWIRAQLPFLRDPKLTQAELDAQDAQGLAECWKALEEELAKEAAGLKEPHPCGIPWPTDEELGADGGVLMIVGEEDGDPPAMQERDRDEVEEEWFGTGVVEHLPHDGRRRVVAYANIDMDRWEIRQILPGGKLGPIEASGRCEDEAPPPPHLRLVN